MKEAWRRIEDAKSLTLLTHVNPDADTLGSALGMYHVLKHMGKKVHIFNATRLPYNLDFLPGITKVRDTLQEAECYISFDAGSFDRLGIKNECSPLINIDHHATNTRYGTYNIIDPEAAATAQVVYDFCKANGARIPKESALCFYTALVDDCGFFKYESVDARVFEFAKELCEAGAEPEYVAQMLTMREPLAKLRLIQKVLATLELKINAKVAIVYLTQKMLAETGGTKEMADDALNMARSLATVEVAVLMREEEDGRIKVSLRSKSTVDVGSIAVRFGGGGHKRAAGFTSDLHDFATVVQQVLEVLKGELVAQ